MPLQQMTQQPIPHSTNSFFKLIVRQQPSKARLCSFKEKVDRRPIDPPPIIQLISTQGSSFMDDEFLQNPYFFLYATLTDASGEHDLHFVNGNRTTAGTVVQSLYKLKDIDNSDGGFFIFSDVSVRLEGLYRLKFTLYEIEGSSVNRICSNVSDIFHVYSPKSFPGMSESTLLTRSFSDQGVRIRIRKEPRGSSSNTSNGSGKKRRKTEDTNDSDDDDQHSIELSPLSKPQQMQSYYYSLPPKTSKSSSSFYDRSPSPLPEPRPYASSSSSITQQNPALPSPKELSRSSPMSMQNLLSNSRTPLVPKPSPPPLSMFLHEVKEEDHSYLHHHSSSHNNNDNRLFTTRKLPLPIPTPLAFHNNNEITQQHHHSFISPVPSDPPVPSSPWTLLNPREQQQQQQRLPPIPRPPSSSSSTRRRM